MEYYLAGERQRIRFNAYQKAFSQAEEIATELSIRSEVSQILSGDEQKIYCHQAKFWKRVEKACKCWA